jgi:hypothetical protein
MALAQNILTRNNLRALPGDLHPCGIRPPGYQPPGSIALDNWSSTFSSPLHWAPVTTCTNRRARLRAGLTLGNAYQSLSHLRVVRGSDLTGERPLSESPSAHSSGFPDGHRIPPPLPVDGYPVAALLFSITTQGKTILRGESRCALCRQDEEYQVWAVQVSVPMSLFLHAAEIGTSPCRCDRSAKKVLPSTAH